VIDGRRTAPAKIRIQRAGANPWYEVQLIEGRNRQIRKMFLALGVLVEKIRRVSVGPLHLGKLTTGRVRELTGREIERMQAMWDPKAAKKRPVSRRRPAAETKPAPRPGAKKAAKRGGKKVEKKPSRKRAPVRR
jgi:23S rRNA pseudouridine2605 synthase